MCVKLGLVRDARKVSAIEVRKSAKNTLINLPLRNNHLGLFAELE